MDLVAFKQSLSAEAPPTGLPVYLRALWFDGRGSWEEAHKLVQDLANSDAAWIHAYLHRKEGDIANADYWYQKAGKLRPAEPPDQEWETLVRSFLPARN